MLKHILLTVDEVCEFEMLSYSAVKKKIKRGTLKAKKIKTNRGCGFEYRIDLQDLSETAKVKYYASQKKNIDNKYSENKSSNIDKNINKYSNKKITGDDEYRKGRVREADKSCRDININETDNDRKIKGDDEYRKDKRKVRKASDYYGEINKNEIIENIDEIEINNNEYNWKSLTDSQKEKAYLWEAILRTWREYVENFNGKETDATDEFVKEYNKKGEVKISKRTLYRKWNVYKDNGICALADFRGKKNATGNEIDEEVWNIFQDWYLDINKPKIAFLYKALTYHFEMEKPELLPLPSETTFRRAIERKIPKSVITYFREGKKVWTDECAYYLRRDYSSLSSNDVWTSDYHTLDFFVKDDVTGDIYRPHLVIWSDIKSRKILSMRLRRSSDSDGVFLSLREAVKKYGAPETIYLDNGREFLSSDIGGRGRRKKDINADYGKTLFERLKIKMVNAKVANGRAKIAERQFNTITNQFARMIKTYCGNKPTTRPEGHLDILKDEKNIPLLSEIENELREYIEGYYNNIESNAEGLEKTSPNKAYEKHLLKKRTLTDTMLDELLLRTAKLQTYKRNGVYVQIGNTKVYFYNSDITMKYLDKKVYVRYDPDKLTEVIIEDEKGRYIGRAKREITGGYGLANDTEAIKYLGKTNKKLEKIVKDYKKVEEMIDVPSVREVINKKSKDMIRTNNEIYYAKVIEPIFNINKNYANKKAVGAENITENMIDFERMIENARKNKEE
ncbi:MAG: transposase domain-containing protein [Peptoanaerobacter stomatis]|uniref:transposase domain-containing protein n=1 Tax=Peptoanaerobacter stomatis TaxID=796937 RepID=UPI003FA13FB9